MDPEEFQRIKEAEKEHLRRLKQLKDAVRALERQRRVNESLESMARASEEAFSTQAEMVERLALETARREARADIALEAAGDKTGSEEPGSEKTAGEKAAAGAAAQEAFEEEARAARARELIHQMKVELGGGSPPPDAPPAAAEKSIGRTAPETGRTSGEEPEDPAPSPAKRPEKTIGRM